MTTFPIVLEQPHRQPRRKYGQHAVALSATDVLRRLLNIAIAFSALVLVLPLMLIVAVAVKLSSPGPVFYTQTRIGLNRRRRLPPGMRYRDADCGGKPFTIFKFRTMRVNGAAADGGGDAAAAPAEQVWATPDDPRVTRVGRILRLYRLDELPQLVNVLFGDMNIVGPRPEQPVIFAQLRDEIPDYQQRQCVRPGITGWAQVNLHYDTSIEDVRRKLAFDLEYVGRHSLTEDLRIMLRTLPVVAGRFGGW
jgi:lipopolysaccharide/colanic/teichoic acid biosynthesis glycosyltransferase